MLEKYLQIHSLAIVILGDFNPAIIQPFWLAQKGLIKDQEAHAAKVDIIHPQLAQFELDWVSIDVSPDRLIVKTSKTPYFAPVVDLVIGILNLLPETPLKAVGINHDMHFAMPTEAEYLAIGRSLVPLSNWENVLKDPKVLEVNMIEQKRSDKLSGHYSIRIRPSDQKLSSAYALLVGINDHLSLEVGEDERKSKLVERLTTTWPESYKRANYVKIHLLENSKIIS